MCGGFFSMFFFQRVLSLCFSATCGSPALFSMIFIDSWLQSFLWMAHQVWFIKSFISFERWGLLHFSPIKGSMLPKECCKTCRIRWRDGTDFQRLTIKTLMCVEPNSLSDSWLFIFPLRFLKHVAFEKLNGIEYNSFVCSKRNVTPLYPVELFLIVIKYTYWILAAVFCSKFFDQWHTNFIHLFFYVIQIDNLQYIHTLTGLHFQ